MRAVNPVDDPALRHHHLAFLNWACVCAVLQRASAAAAQRQSQTGPLVLKKD